MRYPARAVFGLAICLAMTAGCSATRRPNPDAHGWWWHKDASTAHRASVPEPAPEPSANKHQALADQHGLNFAHPRVDDFVTRFQNDRRGFFSRALSRSGRYVPRMSSILAKEGVPPEFAYLPLIESGFRLNAHSPAGAVGPWQFIQATGRRYGLRIDGYVDERRDPIKSTRAAARYLKDLYSMFGDWELSFAAYNTGEGRIGRILEGGLATDFWEMRDRGYLYRETCDYVPGFLAALQIAVQPEAYGFEPPYHDALRYDVVVVDRRLSLESVARATGTSAETLKELNPALHRGFVPPGGYAVRVPDGMKGSAEVAIASLPTEPEVRKVVRRAQSRGRTTGRYQKAVKRRGAPVAAVRQASARTTVAGRPATTTQARVGRKAAREATPLVTARRDGRRRVVD